MTGLALLGLLASPPAAAGLRDACVEGGRLSTGVDAVTVYDGRLYGAWLLSEPAADVAWTTSLAQLPCLRLGLREHAFLSLLFYDPGGQESGWELQNKLSAAVGSELGWGRWAVGGYLLPGARLTVVRQSARYPEHGIDQDYAAAGLLPTLYAWQVTRFWITDRVGLHADLQWTLLYPYRENGWYSNRVLGAGLSFRGRG